MAPGKPRSPMCSRAATRCWCSKAAASRSAGARPRACSACEVEILPGDFRRAVQARGGRGAAEGRPQGRDQGDPGRADRHRVRRRQRHQGDRRGDPRGRPRRAADGRRGRLARLHAVRDGRLGRGRRDVGLAEGPDDAAGPRLRRGGPARAARRTRRPDMRTPYWDWTFREGESITRNIAGTPPEHLLFALRAALDMIFAEGLENVFHRHRLLAEATRRAVGTWAEGQAIAFNVVRAGGALRHGDRRRHAQRRERAAARRLCAREMRRGARARARPIRGQGASASPIWATSTRR